MKAESNYKINKVVIAGGGTAGWMAATALARAFRGAYQIVLVESEQIGAVGVGEATIPQIKLFNNVAGLDEREFLAATNGTIKLGIQFNDWGNIGDSYFHAFGGIGASLGMLDFYHYWLRYKAQGGKNSLWEYSLNVRAARENKFAPIEKIGDTPLAGLVHAYHFDASLFAKHLRSIAESMGVFRKEGIIESVIKNSDTGFIESLVLAGGEQVSGDFFFDCTGFSALLIEKALGIEFCDWSETLMCNRAVTVGSEITGPLQPYTQASAKPAGWQWHIPLRHRAGNGHVYCSNYMSDDEASGILLKNLKGKPLSDPRVIKFKAGKRVKLWEKNCVALGLSSGFLEPLESTSIHLIQHALLKIIDFFPTGTVSSIDVDEFNRHMSAEYDGIKDFIVLHYKATSRSDSPFWLACREMKIGERLQQKMDLFKYAGRTLRDGNELFSELAWLQVMYGQGIKPEVYHPLADAITPEQLAEFFGNIEHIQSKVIQQIPEHQEFLKKYTE